MRRFTTCAAVLSVPVLLGWLSGCGGAAAETDEPAPETEVRAAEPKSSRAEAAPAEPAPPDDYVRSRCTACSCRMFTGDTGRCSRPSCHHGWKDHRSQLAG
jgi:hypothetical protein